MNNLLLDCTLRDGAHVNNGDFGQVVANTIVSSLVQSSIDLIEVGFIEPLRSTSSNTFFSTTDACQEFFCAVEKKKSKIGVMLRSDRCPLDAIKKNEFIDFIRIAFYPDQTDQVVKYVNRCKEMGYQVFTNLIGITNYTEEVIHSIIEEFQISDVDGMSVVDTYGALDKTSVNRLISIFDTKMPRKRAIGLHLHENLSSSMLLVDQFNSYDTQRTKIFDASLAGMGRIPGNLPIELIASYLNKHGCANYKIEDLYDAVTLISKFKSVSSWGYSAIYSYAATMGLDRTYPEYFNDLGLSERQIFQSLRKIKKDYRDLRFNEQKALNALLTMGIKNKNE